MPPKSPGSARAILASVIGAAIGFVTAILMREEPSPLRIDLSALGGLSGGVGVSITLKAKPSTGWQIKTTDGKRSSIGGIILVGDVAKPVGVNLTQQNIDDLNSSGTTVVEIMADVDGQSLDVGTATVKSKELYGVVFHEQGVGVAVLE